jgi:RNA polymerase sigma-70 factor (ECF subfamily)
MTQLTDAANAVDAHTAEDALLQRLRCGDSAAFAEIVSDWSPVMLHVARRYVGDLQTAQDVVQGTWLGVINGLDRFEGRSSLRSWAFSILINRAKTRSVRDRRIVPSALLTGSPDPDTPTVDPARFQGPEGEYPGHWTSVGAPQPWPAPEDGVLGTEVTKVVEQALNALPERQRIVVQMRDLQGMTAEETCSALALTQQNQRVLLHRGRVAIRAALEEYHRA